MAYARTTTVDAAPSGDTVKQAVLDVDTDLTGLFGHLNDHEAATTAIHGVGAGTICGTTLTQTLTNKTLSSPTLTGTLVGFPITWTATATNFTAAPEHGYLVDTTGAVVTMTLPSSPSEGDKVYAADQAGTFSTNKLTVGRNSTNIMSLAEDMDVDINYARFGLVYSGSATDGWRLV